MLIDFIHKKILIIDDFSEFRHVMRRMLESFGAKHIDDVKDGENAIRHMLLKAYDIILCDYNLGHGKKDGQQVLEEAKHRDLLRFSSIFIMVTAENTMPMIMGAFEYQPDDYLIKPITKEILKNRIERILKKKADFEDIDVAIRRKEYLRAIALCDDRIQNRPKNKMEYLRLKSELCMTAGRYDEANAVFEHVLSLRDIPWAKMGLGKVLFHSGDYLKAREIFQSVIEVNKNFMEAYDWLSKTLKELGSLEEAQQVLITACDISPKSILRHKEIADISSRLHDYDKAEDALKSAVTIGKNSCYKSASDYTGLAKILVNKDSKKALSVLSDARNEFKDSQEAILQAAVVEGIVYKEMNQEEKAMQAVNEASKLVEDLDGKIPTDVTMDLARTCFELGEKEKGINLMQTVVKNNHDNDEILKMAQGVFEDVKLQKEGARIISSCKKEIIQLNNEGVRLVKEGRLKEAIEYFEKAAVGLPDNKIINANAALAFMRYMQKNGRSDEHMYRVSHYLDRINKIDPSYKDYPSLMNMYERLTVTETHQGV